MTRLTICGFSTENILLVKTAYNTLQLSHVNEYFLNMIEIIDCLNTLVLKEMFSLRSEITYWKKMKNSSPMEKSFMHWNSRLFNLLFLRKDIQPLKTSTILLQIDKLSINFDELCILLAKIHFAISYLKKIHNLIESKGVVKNYMTNGTQEDVELSLKMKKNIEKISIYYLDKSFISLLYSVKAHLPSYSLIILNTLNKVHKKNLDEEKKIKDELKKLTELLDQLDNNFNLNYLHSLVNPMHYQLKFLLLFKYNEDFPLETMKLKLSRPTYLERYWVRSLLLSILTFVVIKKGYEWHQSGALYETFLKVQDFVILKLEEHIIDPVVELIEKLFDTMNNDNIIVSRQELEESIGAYERMLIEFSKSKEGKSLISRFQEELLEKQAQLKEELIRNKEVIKEEILKSTDKLKKEIDLSVTSSTGVLKESIESLLEGNILESINKVSSASSSSSSVADAALAVASIETQNATREAVLEVVDKNSSIFGSDNKSSFKQSTNNEQFRESIGKSATSYINNESKIEYYPYFRYVRPKEIDPRNFRISPDAEEALAALMTEYERELQTPIRGMVYGSLFTSLLVQVQKLKIHTEALMLKMDKVLKSNELTMAATAAMPAVLCFSILFSGIRYLFTPRAHNPGKSALHFRLILSDVERSLGEIAEIQERKRLNFSLEDSNAVIAEEETTTNASNRLRSLSNIQQNWENMLESDLINYKTSNIDPKPTLPPFPATIPPSTFPDINDNSTTNSNFINSTTNSNQIPPYLLEYNRIFAQQSNSSLILKYPKEWWLAKGHLTFNLVRLRSKFHDIFDIDSPEMETVIKESRPGSTASSKFNIFEFSNSESSLQNNVTKLKSFDPNTLINSFSLNNSFHLDQALGINSFSFSLSSTDSPSASFLFSCFKNLNLFTYNCFLFFYQNLYLPVSNYTWKTIKVCSAVHDLLLGEIQPTSQTTQHLSIHKDILLLEAPEFEVKLERKIETANRMRNSYKVFSPLV